MAGRGIAAHHRRKAPVAEEPNPRSLSVGLPPTLLGYNLRQAQIALWRDINRTVG
jgi:hypothetical protein